MTGPAALRTDQIGRERGRGERDEEDGESEAHRKVAERISGSGTAQRKTARDGREQRGLFEPSRGRRGVL